MHHSESNTYLDENKRQAIEDNLCYMIQEHCKINNKAKEMKVDYDRLEEKYESLEIKYENKADNLEVAAKERNGTNNKFLNC